MKSATLIVHVEIRVPDHLTQEQIEDLCLYIPHQDVKILSASGGCSTEFCETVSHETVGVIPTEE